MIEPEWKFREPQESEMNQDPIEGEFFTTQDVGDFADALVRESIQNSLDAKRQNKKHSEESVAIRFYFSGKTNAKDIHINKSPYFKGIYYHILCKDNGLNKNELPDFSKPTEYLVIEDFQTVGLDGDIKENDVPETDSPLGHNFFWFWRNVGRSGKKGAERGKWGLGKTVFPATSLINTFFGLTNRYDDNKTYLMGLCVLKTHHINSEPNKKLYPYGYFGNFINSSDKYFATPVDEDKCISEFRATLNLKREIHSDPGLSIVIPFPRKEITSTEVIKSTLRQYFYPIMKGNLKVEVIDNDNNINIQIDNKTIFDFLNDFGSSENGNGLIKLRKLFELCSWALSLKEDDFIILNEPPTNSSTMWRKDWFVTELINDRLVIAGKEFDNEERLAFKVPIRIVQTDETPEICWFNVYLEKDDSLGEANSHFVRNGITITGVKKPKIKNIRAIIVIEDESLVRLLGDAENPAHTEWQKNSSHFRGKYTGGDNVISFIERIVDNLCSLLIKPPEGIDKDLLADIFYLDNEEIESDEKQPKDPEDDPGNDGQDRPSIETISNPSPFKIEQKIGGFLLRRNPKVPDWAGTIKIELAYMVIDGNPIKKYSPFDFELTNPPIKINPINISNLDIKSNTVMFNANSESDFSIEIDGFDEARDLFIKAKKYDQEI